MVFQAPKSPAESNRWHQARFWVESDRLPFFDYFRDWAFGFVETEPGRGFYARIRYDIEKILAATCSCLDGRAGRLCAHAAAVHLQVLNWPKPALDLSNEFETWYVTAFFKELHLWANRSQPQPEPKPMCDLSPLKVHPRMSAYFGFSDSLGAVTKNDRILRGWVIHNAHTKTEKEMIRRGLKSTRVLFEEGPWFSLVKFFFIASEKDALVTTASSTQGDSVTIQFAIRNIQVFSCEIPIDVFFRILRRHPDQWLSQTDFKVQIRALPLVYRIQFVPSGDLEIQSGIRVSESEMEPIQTLQVAKAKNLFFHKMLGYFHTQIGLTPFEMAFSDGLVHIIEAQSVAGFLEKYRPLLEKLDRGFIDPLIFEELVLEKIDRVSLTLLDFAKHQFEAEMEVHAGQAVFSAKALEQIKGTPARFAKIAGRLIDTKSRDWEFLLDVVQDPGKTITLKTKELFRLTGYFSQQMEISTTDQTEETFNTIVNTRAKNPPDLDHTRLDLRPYQMQGYDWLFFLFSYQLGGLLCDQMGLGKTHQAMALIGALFKNAPDSQILVICPASVIYHWEQLLERFGPFPARLYHGADRQNDQMKDNGVVTITTYPTMRNDFSLLSQFRFDLIVLDEIQMAKNPSTKTHKAVAGLKASMKIGLTGTPIENHLADLKALLDLVMPGYLGDNKLFRRNFEIPIINYQSKTARQKLRDIIGPFMLRRSKSEVLPELPPVTETRHVFSLSSYETTLYNKIKKEGKSADKAKESSSRYLHIFNVIDRLKRVCDHPALYFNRVDYAAFPATKWELFTQILNEALNCGEKVVVFTQYLGMIALFRQYLDNHHIPYACITGQTRDRKKQIQKFQNEGACRVFLGTIRTSGLGIDLHAGRVLIHYDRWWNPAREEQATSRVHRIGQRHGVQVFHLLGKNTIEERIDEIIQSKRELLDGIVQFDAKIIGKLLTLEELLGILE